MYWGLPLVLVQHLKVVGLCLNKAKDASATISVFSSLSIWMTLVSSYDSEVIEAFYGFVF